MYKFSAFTKIESECARAALGALMNGRSRRIARGGIDAGMFTKTAFEAGRFKLCPLGPQKRADIGTRVDVR